ncbi:MAG TPA: tetratricopeptide repeat protein, partial [Thermodesulfovibrionales bacterium]|nr:tetratricopeptide repeat protein [Thermodesulfovibrionales bacterium]
MGKITGKSKPELIIAFLLILAVFFAGRVSAASRDIELFDRGYGYYLSYQPEKAAETFKAFLNEFPQSSAKDAVMFWLGKSLIQMKSYEEAEKILSELREKLPDSPFAGYALQEIDTLRKAKSGNEVSKPRPEVSSAPKSDESESTGNVQLAAENQRAEILEARVKRLSEKKKKPADLEEKAKELEAARQRSEELQKKVKDLEEEKKKSD